MANVCKMQSSADSRQDNMSHSSSEEYYMLFLVRHTAITQISSLKNQISQDLNKFLSDQGTEPSSAAY